MGAAGLGLLAGCGGLPGQGQAPTRVPRIGYLQGSAAAADTGASAGLLEGLGELGYVEGQNLLIEWRYTMAESSRVQEQTAELVAIPVDVLLTGGIPTAEAARAATSTIPIVMVYPGDLVAAGFVASLARPGGNITGMTEFTGQLAAKRLELLKVTVPSIARVAVPQNPANAELGGALRLDDALQVAAQTLGVELVRLDVRVPSDLDAALGAAARAGADAVCWVGGTGFRHPEFGTRLGALAAQYQLPAICGFPEWVPAGVLMAYAPDYADLWRRAAYYVDRILKGTQPADLPIEQPMR